MLKLAWKYMRYYKSQTFAIFASILLTASLLSGISSLIYSSQKSDLANSKTIYGDWHYYIETDKELFNSVESGEKGKGYTLEQCGKMEIRDVVAEEFMICFIHADETYRQMAHTETCWKEHSLRKKMKLQRMDLCLVILDFQGI